MSLFRHLPRRATSGSFALRHFSASTETAISESSSPNRHRHDYLPPTSYIDSWKQPRNPREANKQLALLRRDYDRKMKEIRKEYIKEVELQRIEKLKKDEARKEALRIANEEKRAAKAAKKKAEAIERQAAEEEFRQMLMKERAEKLEYWRMREEKFEKKKKEKNELLRRQSSLWVSESEIEKKAFIEIISNSKSHHGFNY